MLRGSEGDHLRKVTMLTRARRGPPKLLGAGGGAADEMVELLSCYLVLPTSAPFFAFGCGSGRWFVWTQAQSTRALWQVVSVVGVQAEDYTLQPLSIGDATHLWAGGDTAEVLEREGRWASRAYKGYVHNKGDTHRECPEGWLREVRVSRNSRVKGLGGVKYNP